MCLEDLFIARHTVYKMIATASTINIPASQNRMGLVFCISGDSTWSAADGTVIARWNIGAIVTSYVTTDTNEVPPTDNTGTIALNGSQNLQDTRVLRLADFGSAIRDQTALVNGSGANMRVLEILPDQVLDKMIQELESKEGWPLYGLTGRK